MCILAFQNFLTPLGPGQPYGQASLAFNRYLNTVLEVQVCLLPYVLNHFVLQIRIPNQFAWIIVSDQPLFANH